jgi:hypothetical protein
MDANSKGDFQSIARIPAIPCSGVNTVLDLKLQKSTENMYNVGLYHFLFDYNTIFLF